MPQGMNLMNDAGGPGRANSDTHGISFAIRALAVLRVHDSDAAKAKGLTLRQISEADFWLNDHLDGLTSQLFRAFGRHCEPVLRKFMLDVETEADLEAHVTKIQKQLEQDLGL